ncbi:MAG: anaerobic ribonucleoside-triphosphate reductase activating protein [Bacilli bacterium]|nr:anaerobic ribonucleoside-triphosphate reductase activating protein [Bacilli bacterium]
MDFSGWEKLSLLDFDDNISTTLFTAGCNFRCPFCHNSSLVLDPTDAPTIPWSEIREYLIKRKKILDAVCITGGEPTLMPDLEDKLKEIKEIGYIVKLDTNGSHPEVLKRLVEHGLVDYVAMDIKNSKEKYGETIGIRKINIKNIQESVEYLLTNGIPFEFRTTIIDEYHSKDDFVEIGKWIKGAKRYYLQRYIDSENCIAHGLHMIPKEKALEYKALLEQYIDHVSLRGYD